MCPVSGGSLIVTTTGGEESIGGIEEGVDVEDGGRSELVRRLGGGIEGGFTGGFASTAASSSNCGAVAFTVFGGSAFCGGLGAAPRASGAGIARGVGFSARDGRPIGTLRGTGRFDGRGGGGRLLVASGRTAGSRVVESMRVGGTASCSSASE
jgi:hypothetical protein